ncbi:MAG: hypothetical protein ACTH0V_00725 [Microbacteriaceae bacterium]
MTNLSPAARAIQESARQTDGKFGNQQHSPPQHGLAAKFTKPDETDTVRARSASWLLQRLSSEKEWDQMRTELRELAPDAQHIELDHDPDYDGVEIAAVYDAGGVQITVDPAREDGWDDFVLDNCYSHSEWIDMGRPALRSSRRPGEGPGKVDLDGNPFHSMNPAIDQVRDLAEAEQFVREQKMAAAYEGAREEFASAMPDVEKVECGIHWDVDGPRPQGKLVPVRGTGRDGRQLDAGELREIRRTVSSSDLASSYATDAAMLDGAREVVFDLRAHQRS